jgi:hypothetical protein
LSDSHRDVAREAGLAVVTLAELWADDLDGLGGRCFVKHCCVPLDGDDVRPRLPACGASPEVAWAFNHNTAVAVADAQRCLARARTAVAWDRFAGVSTLPSERNAATAPGRLKGAAPRAYRAER